MSVEWTKLSVPLGKGINTKTDPKALPPTELTTLQNGVFTDDISIKKRNGYTSLGSATSSGIITDIEGLVSHDKELMLLSSSDIFSYSSSQEEWINKGKLHNTKVETTTKAYTTSDQIAADFAETNGVYLYAWEVATGGVHISMEDKETGTVLLDNYKISNDGSNVRVVGFKGAFHVFFTDAANNNLYNKRVSSVDIQGTVGNAAILFASNLDSNNPTYDVKNYRDVSAVLMYCSTSTGSNIEGSVCFVGLDGTVGSPSNGGFAALTLVDFGVASRGAGESSSMSVAVDPLLNDIIVACTDGAGNVVHGLYDTNLLIKDSLVTAAISDTLGVAPLDGYDEKDKITVSFTGAQNSEGDRPYHIWYEPRASTVYESNVYRFKGHATASGITLDRNNLASSDSTIRVNLASHAHYFDGQAYVNLQNTTAQQPTYFTVDGEDNIVARYLDGIAGDLDNYMEVLPSMVHDPNTEGHLYWAGTYRNRLPVETGAATQYTEQGIKQVKLDVTGSSPPKSVSIGKSTYITGGYLQQFDGVSAVETNFHLYPENITTSTGTGGSMTSSATYGYRCYWEWYNSHGEREISTTSEVVQVTLGASDTKVTLTVPTLTMTAKKGSRNDARLAVTRTVGGGSTYYRVDDPTSPVFNDPGAWNITFEDTLSDVNLQLRELDYLNAEVENTSPKYGSVIGAGKDRVFIAGSEEPSLVQYSKVHNWGDAVAFSPSLRMEVDDRGGAITAIAPMDDKIIIFKESNIYASTGDGPNNNTGDFNNFAPPQFVTSDAGCINQNSVVETPVGLMFQSKKGIYLLGRGLELSYVGAPVEQYNDLTIKSAELLADRNLVLFLTDGKFTLVYDYYFEQWSTFTNHSGYAATLWDGTYVYGTKDGDVLKEDKTTFRDRNTAIKMSMETGWISFEHLQNFARVRRAYLLGEYKSPHTLRVKIAYDYKNTYVHTVTWDPTEVLDLRKFGTDTAIGDTVTFGSGTGKFGGSGDKLYQVRIQMPRQKCQAVKFKFEDVVGNDPGESFELNNLLLEVGIKDTPFKMGSNKTIGRND